MKIALGADHKGYEVKKKVKELLTAWGHDVVDFGTNSTQSVDYPDYGLKVANAVAQGATERGVTVCWTGNGMNMVANKVRGVRAGLALTADMAYLTRLHNDANVLTLASKFTAEDQLEEILRRFLDTEFEGGRHVPRLKKIEAAEKT